MKSKPGPPSPAMVVALIALVLAGTGSAIAAVTYATNAGAVDGKSAVASGATLNRAAGKLVATQRSGSDRGRIATKYLDLDGYTRGVTASFGRSFDVTDNATGATTVLAAIPGVGALTSTCSDQNAAAQVEDPITTIILSNTSREPINVARSVGWRNPAVLAQLNGTQSAFNVGGSDTFQIHLERRGVNAIVQGVVRQDGRGTPAADCLVYGFALLPGD